MTYLKPSSLEEPVYDGHGGMFFFMSSLAEIDPFQLTISRQFPPRKSWTRAEIVYMTEDEMSVHIRADTLVIGMPGPASSQFTRALAAEVKTKHDNLLLWPRRVTDYGCSIDRAGGACRDSYCSKARALMPLSAELGITI